MLDVLLDGVLDTLKLIPYLFITFLILEFIENKWNNQKQKRLMSNKKYGPVIGAFLGVFPECGFGSIAANLFSARVISLGTLIAVFLATSDEMLPVMISQKVNISLVLKIILFKIIIGLISGFIIDLFFNKKQSNKTSNISQICEHDHCSCNRDGIILASIKHTLKTTFFILIVNLLINAFIYYIGEDKLASLLLHGNILTYFIASLIGLIPNCSGSIIITQLYLANFISLGTMLAGLLSGSGVGILLLFKTNKNLKENLFILSIIYFIGVIIGILLDLIL